MWTTEFVECLEKSTVANPTLHQAQKLKEKYIPPKIFKYRRDCEKSRTNLKDETLWFASPTTYNDPYDSQFRIEEAKFSAAVNVKINQELVLACKLDKVLSGEKIAALVISDNALQLIAEYVEKYQTVPHENLGAALQSSKPITAQLIKDILTIPKLWREKLTKVCSFSAANDSLLMWGHYGADHTGFCIEYDLQNLPPENSYRKFLYPVVYSNEFYNLTPWAESLPKAKSEKFNQIGPLLSLLHKFEGWSYEKEWRLIIIEQTEIPDQNLPTPSPSRVFLGSRVSNETKAEIVQVCVSKNIEVHQMRLRDDKFELYSEKIA